MKTLGEIFEIGSGGTPSKTHPEYYDGNIPWVKTGDLKDEYLYSVEDCISEEGLNNSSAKMYPSGTVLIAMYGATIGATSILKFDACTNQACAAFKPREEVLPEYLYYFLRSKKQKFISDGVGGAQPNISAGYLKKVSIDIRNIKEQEKIVTVLDKLNGIIQKRQKEIDELDELIKARFVELFSQGKHKLVKASEVCDFITKGTTPPTGEIIEEYGEGMIPFLKVYNLSFTGELLFDDNPQYIPKETHNGKLARSKVYPNDVLMNIVGPPLGKFTIVTDEYEEWNINQAIAIFRAKERILPRFLLHALMQPTVLEPFIGQAVGIRQQNLSLEQCRNLQFPLPSIEEQQAFVKFAEQVDKSKVAVQKSLDEMQILFDSLMQKYFG